MSNPTGNALAAPVEDGMSRADWLRACTAWLDTPEMRSAVLEHIEYAADALDAMESYACERDQAYEALQRIASKVKVLRGSGRLKRAVESNPQTTEEFLATTAVNIERIALKVLEDGASDVR